MVKNKIKSNEIIENKPIFNSTKIEGSIIKILDSTSQNTGNFSIAQAEIFSNEETLTPIQNISPKFKTLKELKNYYEINGKTYGMISNMFAQSPCFTNVKDYYYQTIKSDIVEATPCKYKSVNCNINTFQILTNASLRLKWTGSTTNRIELKATNVNDAIKEIYTNKALNAKMVYLDNGSYKANKNFSLCDSKLERIAPKYNAEGQLVEVYKTNSKKDTINKFVLSKEKDTFYANADNTHYMEVNGLNFSTCQSMEDVLNILNQQGFNCVFSYEDNKLVIKTKGVGTQISIEVVACTSPDVVVDLKDVLFGNGTPASITTSELDPTTFTSVSDGALNLEINGIPTETTGIDLSSITHVSDIKDVLAGKSIAGITFDLATENTIKITTITTGASAKIRVLTASTGTDLGALLDFKAPIDGSDGAIQELGTNASGSNMLEKYNELRNYQQLGCVLSSTMALDIDFLYQLNADLVANINLGNRVIFLHTIEDPYMTEASSHGALADWLRSDLLGLYCGAMVDKTNLEARGAILSMSLGQDVFNTNLEAGSKNDLHMKDIIIPTANVNQSINNDLLALINDNGCGAISYFQEGFGWKLTIPSAENVWTWVDAVNMQNIIKTFSMKLANMIATRKYTNKTNDVVSIFHNNLYQLCSVLTANGVLTGDVSDFSSIPVDVDVAKDFIINSPYHTYFYTPKVQDIIGKRIPITAYMGFANSVYGFEIQNVYLS